MRRRGASPRPRAASARRSASSWEGVDAWRALPLDERRAWRDADAVDDPRASSSSSSSSSSSLSDDACLATRARAVLEEACPRRKAALTHDAYARLARGEIEVCGEKYLDTMRTLPNRPARPEKPRLVSPKEVPSPKNSPLGPTAHVVHGLAHVELNAVDLAWDTVARFASLRGVLPDQFFIDFAHVADDESRHLLWCLQRLEELGVSYGDVPAHDVLWEGAEATADDPLARLAVVPCMQEARGLDAGPRLAERLVGHGDNVSAAIVRRISEEELGHVAVGAAWFREVCDALSSPESGSDERADDDDGIAAATFRAYIHRLAPGSLRGPFNVDDRARAGIHPSWYAEDAKTSVPVARPPRLVARDPALVRKLRDRLEHVVAIETGASNA